MQLLQTNDDMVVGRAQAIDPAAAISGPHLQLSIDARATRRGRTVRAKDHLLDTTQQRQVMSDLLRISHHKLTALGASPLQPETHQTMKAPGRLWDRDRIIIGLLAPDIQKALLLGTAPPGLYPDKLVARDMPLDWAEQRRFLGLPPMMDLVNNCKKRTWTSASLA